MGMKTIRVVSVWIFPGIQQQLYDFGMAELRRQREGSVPAFGVCLREQSSRLLKPAQAGGCGKMVYRRPPPGEPLGGVQISERQRGHQSGVPFRAASFKSGAIIEQQ